MWKYNIRKNPLLYSKTKNLLRIFVVRLIYFEPVVANCLKETHYGQFTRDYEKFTKNLCLRNREGDYYFFCPY